MSNILADPNLWQDYQNTTPPIWWNPDTSAYEVLEVTPSGSGNGNFMRTAQDVSAPAGAIIEFDYSVDSIVAFDSSSNSTLRLRLYAGGSNDVVWELTVPVMGKDSPTTPPEWPLVGSASVDCDEGEWYAFRLETESSIGFPLYGFEAIITPTGGPVPPDTPSGGRVFVARHQFRAYAGAATALRCWIRDEAGRHDLSGAEVSVLVKRPNGYVIATLPATGSDQGGVAFEVSADTISQQLAPGVFNVEILADGSVVGLGHLEVLG